MNEAVTYFSQRFSRRDLQVETLLNFAKSFHRFARYGD
ncbi:hypothetical protein R2A130_1760 [Ahrensia sp. R2A130]|nr:hypothetical protein R2A130_1760 [Ahrensia sp. R2A130]